MARFATFEDALAVVAAHERLSASTLGEALGVSAQAAGSLLRLLQQDGHVGPDEGDGWHHVGGRGRKRWEQQSFSSTPETRIAQLEGEVARLRAALFDAETARSVADAVSAKAPKTRPISVTRRRLKRLLARELHPDQQGRSDAEREVYGEIFKRSWPRLEMIIAGRDPDDA